MASSAAGVALADPLSLSESDPDPDPDEEAAFFAAFFGAGLALLSLSLSDDDEAAFLAAFFGGALAAGSEESESESDDEATFCFLAGAFLPLLPALAPLLALTFEAALDLLAGTDFLAGTDESESESLLLLSCFLDFFATTLATSLLCFLTLAGGASDELSLSLLLLTTGFFCRNIKLMIRILFFKTLPF